MQWPVTHLRNYLHLKWIVIITLKSENWSCESTVDRLERQRCRGFTASTTKHILSVLTCFRQLTLTHSAIFKFPSKTCKLLRWPRRRKRDRTFPWAKESQESSQQPQCHRSAFCVLKHRCRSRLPTTASSFNLGLHTQQKLTLEVVQVRILDSSVLYRMDVPKLG